MHCKVLISHLNTFLAVRESLHPLTTVFNAPIIKQSAVQHFLILSFVEMKLVLPIYT